GASSLTPTDAERDTVAAPPLKATMLLFVEFRVLESGVELHVHVAEHLQEFATFGAALARPIVVLQADRHLRFLFQINHRAMTVERRISFDTDQFDLVALAASSNI